MQYILRYRYKGAGYGIGMRTRVLTFALPIPFEANRGHAMDLSPLLLFASFGRPSYSSPCARQGFLSGADTQGTFRILLDRRP